MRKFNVTVNGVSYEVEVDEVSADQSAVSAAPVKAAPASAPAPVQATKPAAPKASANVSGTKVVAPMPGMILNIKVSDGASVKKGQPIIVLEAMKMENDIVAPVDGVVSLIATKGSSVESGELLAVVK